MSLRLLFEQTVHAFVLPFCAAILLFSTRAEATPLWTAISAAHTVSLTTSFECSVPGPGGCPQSPPLGFTGLVTSGELNFDQTLQNTYAPPDGALGITGVSSQSLQMTDNQISLSVYTHASVGPGGCTQGPCSGGPVGADGLSTLDLSFLVSQPLDVTFRYDYQIASLLSQNQSPNPNILTLNEVGVGPLIALVFGPTLNPPVSGSLEGTLRFAPGTYEINAGSFMHFAAGLDVASSGDSHTLIMSAAPAIPEPSAAFVFGTGLVVIATRLRREFLPCNSTQ
jgi:hypothetical protein